MWNLFYDILTKSHRGMVKKLKKLRFFYDSDYGNIVEDIIELVYGNKKKKIDIFKQWKGN